MLMMDHTTTHRERSRVVLLLLTLLAVERNAVANEMEALALLLETQGDTVWWGQFEPYMHGIFPNAKSKRRETRDARYCTVFRVRVPTDARKRAPGT
jgi:hypothetical protein